MSVIIALGSNIGDSKLNLSQAINHLSLHLKLIAASRVYRSAAVDYSEQPDFFNQVLEFETPTDLTPGQLMDLCLSIEGEMGRTRDILRGPRIIDIDIIFWDNIRSDSSHITLPHPRWMERSFIIRPLQELPFFKQISSWHKIPTSFTIEATPI
ncbi:MAG: 2-amino-4-hydroxy-6-hydroxymethyldihydropteridine diphosphokinase [Bacteriovoracaceae bacterium]